MFYRFAPTIQVSMFCRFAFRFQLGTKDGESSPQGQRRQPEEHACKGSLGPAKIGAIAISRERISELKIIVPCAVTEITTSSCWCRNLMYPDASCRTEAVSVCSNEKQR